MTPEQKRQYAKEYREIGAGAMADKRYRAKHLYIIREKDRKRKRKQP